VVASSAGFNPINTVAEALLNEHVEIMPKSPAALCVSVEFELFLFFGCGLGEVMKVIAEFVQGIGERIFEGVSAVDSAVASGRKLVVDEILKITEKDVGFFVGFFNQIDSGFGMERGENAFLGFGVEDSVEQK